MSRRRDRRRRQDRRARTHQATADLLARRNDNLIRLRRRVVFLDRGGLIVGFTFTSWMEAGVLDQPVVPAEKVTVTLRP